MPFKKKQPFERVHYSEDQLLMARDLDDDEHYEATLRRMHVRGLHDTWGVALGFYLSLSNSQDQVLIGPGLAYDALGQELLLSETLTLPPVQNPPGNLDPLAFDLVISARDPGETLASRRRMASCGGKLVGEGVNIRWVLAAKSSSPAADLLAQDVRLGIEVPLGRFVFNPADGSLAWPDLRFRKNARPLLRPHIAMGTIKIYDTGLSPNTLTAETTVMTTNAGFTSTPQYFVFFLNNSVNNENGNTILIGPFLSISHPQYDRFTLRSTFGVTANVPPKKIQELLKAMSVNPIYWVGVEPVTGCQAAPDFSTVYNFSGLLIKEVMSMWSQAMKPFLLAGGFK